jgi:hypothetical protein
LADVSGDGKIDQEEFEGMMKMSRSTGGADNMPDDQIKALFKIFDENGDGRISATEMTHVLGYEVRPLITNLRNFNLLPSTLALPHESSPTFFYPTPAACLAANLPETRRCTDSKPLLLPSFRSMLGRKMSIRRASSIVNGNIGGWGAKKADDAEAGLSYEDFKKVMRRRLFEEDKD